MSNVTSLQILDACIAALESTDHAQDRSLLLRAALRGLESQLEVTRERCRRIRRSIKVDE